MIYGHNKTIHQSGEVNVEVDSKGNVVSVWFRCALLPFTQSVVPCDRAREMRSAYTREMKGIVAVEFSDEPYTGRENEKGFMAQMLKATKKEDE
jgi:hypothetical protein